MAFYQILSSALLCPAIALLGETTANAAPVQSAFQVTSSIPDSCSITTEGLDFGTYDGSQNDQTASVTVACTAKGIPYRIGLNDGMHYSAPNRRLKHSASASYLIYELYRDAGRSARWGIDNASDVDMTSNGMTQRFTIYGRVPAGQSGPVGSYSNTTIVTVNF
jgi:spore coat protein U-like protein